MNSVVVQRSESVVKRPESPVDGIGEEEEEEEECWKRELVAATAAKDDVAVVAAGINSSALRISIFILLFCFFVCA